MSLNKINADGSRLTLHGDYVVKHHKDVEFSLEGDRVPGNIKGSKKGDVFLTTKMIIFSAKNRSSNFQNFSMDFQSTRNIEVKQPIFGANAITGYVLAEPMGGWEGNANFKITFTSGGAIEFAEALQTAVAQAQRRPAVPQTQPAAGYYPPHPTPGGYYYPPQNGYAPQQNGYAPQQNGYAPQQNGYSPQAAGYYGQPGISYAAPVGNPPMQGQAPPPYQAEYNPKPEGASDAKAREAYSSGQNVYIPSSNDNPPPYNPNYNKKTQ